MEEALSQSPSRKSLRNEENETLWCQLEARYCLEVLTPLLESTHRLLMTRRNQFNGTYAGEIKSLQELSEIYSAPETAAEACKPILTRLQEALGFLGISCPAGVFFDDPTAFLSSATQYTRMDRINAAIAQTEALQRSLTKMQTELS